MVDEDLLARWMRLEMGRVNDAVATEQVLLARALTDPGAQVPTRGGRPHVFDRDALEAFAASIGALLRSQLVVPVFLYHGHTEPNDAYVRDPNAIEAIVRMGLVGSTPRQGRLWMGLPLARDLVDRFPTVFQIVTV